MIKNSFYWYENNISFFHYTECQGTVLSLIQKKLEASKSGGGISAMTKRSPLNCV